VEFQEMLAPLPSEHVVEKNVPDALINTGLERWLRVRRITRLAIVGVSTNNSVEATARTAGNLGFETQVVSDATFAFDKVDYTGTQRTAEEVHAMALANLDGEYATITTTGRLINEL
jgi:nicotinamidase-related amidase